MRDRTALVKVVALAAGMLSVAIGLWAFFSPSSFYDQVAGFPPYNRHFVHDIGSFQIGFGVALLLALRWSDALLVVLAGFGVAAAFHFLSHLIDRHLGGHPAVDLAGLGVLAVAALAAAWARLATARSASPDDHPPSGA